MTRKEALSEAAACLDDGRFTADLADLVAIRSELGNAPAMAAYLDVGLLPRLAELGFTTVIREERDGNRFLLVTRCEAASLPTVLLYGHGDVVPGMERDWSAGLSPWTLTQRNGRLYGRGTADNKGQHWINLSALAAVMRVRCGRLGFNVTWLFEMGEEAGSPALRAFCADHRDALAAELFLASDGPRVAADRPTVFLGARGGMQVRLLADLRPQGQHPGNWGGLIANPATLIASAVASLVDQRGRILIAALRPPPMPASVREALSGVAVQTGPDDPTIDDEWGEDGLSPAERVYGSNTLEVLALGAGDIRHPANAIPGRAEALLQLRFVVGTPVQDAGPALRGHLDARGFGLVSVETQVVAQATRLPLDNSWVAWALASIQRSTRRQPALLPNFGGSLPNDVFADELGLPTLWVPHSHPGCNQHAPDEHLLLAVAAEGLSAMAGLFWDLGTLPSFPPRPT